MVAVKRVYLKDTTGVGERMGGQVSSEVQSLLEIDAWEISLICDVRLRVDDHAHHVNVQTGSLFSFFCVDPHLYYLHEGVPHNCCLCDVFTEKG